MKKTTLSNCRALRWGVASLLLLVSVAANAYDFSAQNDDGVTIYYNILSYLKKTCEVTYKDTDYDSYSGKVSIPEAETYNGTTYTVTEIGEYAFRNSSGLTSVIIPNSVEMIGENAFYECTGLTELTIPNSVTEIGEYTFSGCTGLTSITISNSVTSIGSYAFENCTGLTSVTIGKGVTEIGRYAFYNCTGLTEVNFNAIACSSVVSSSSYRAFYGCTNISKVNFGDNVTIIPDYLCYEMTGLTGTLTIPSSVTSIGYGAFESCSALTSVTIPNSVTEIGNYAFYYCI